MLTQFAKLFKFSTIVSDVRPTDHLRGLFYGTCVPQHRPSSSTGPMIVVSKTSACLRRADHDPWHGQETKATEGALALPSVPTKKEQSV
jgi:hypothetical protein